MTGTTTERAELGDSDLRLYVQVARAVRQQITDGELTAGSAVPSITALTGRHGCARRTCTKALQTLEQEGVIVRIPGLGYFVAGGTTAGLAGSNPEPAAPPEGRVP